MKENENSRSFVQNLIKTLDLVPLGQEGGLFYESYRSEEAIPIEALPDRYGGERRHSTAIYYMLAAGEVSRLHRLKSDEIFHFYMGSSVTFLLLFEDGSSRVARLGTNFDRGERPQLVVPKGVWQGAFLEDTEGFALMGTTVAPGFEFDDYEHGNPDRLAEKYPDRAEIIRKLGGNG